MLWLLAEPSTTSVAGGNSVDRLYNTTTPVIRALKLHFARWGIQSTVVSDNWPQYTADKFRKFTIEWDIGHCTMHPGMSTQMVKQSRTWKLECIINRRMKTMLPTTDQTLLRQIAELHHVYDRLKLKHSQAICRPTITTEEQRIYLC